MGFLIDYLGIRKSLLLGILVVSFSSILRYFVKGFGTLFLLVAFFGLGGPLISIGTPKVISIFFHGKERGFASGINASGSSMGSITALALTNSLILPLVGDWKNVFLSYGLFGFTIAVIWLIFISRFLKVDSVSEKKPASQGDAKRIFLENRDIWLIVLIGVVFFLANHSLQNWLPKILEFRGFSPIMAGYATSLMTFFGILGSLFVPRLSYILNSKRLTIAIVLLISGFSISFIGLYRNLALWFGLLLTGFLIRSMMPLLTLTLMDIPIVGSKNMGKIGGLFFSIGEIGGFLGPFLMGYLKELTGSFFSGIFFLSLILEATIILLFFFKDM
jgi:cyanate permease